MAGERTSVYLTADLAAAVKAAGVPLAEIIRRGLTDGTAPAGQPPAPGSPLGAIRAGVPSPGVACMTPGCWQRDTRKYGLRDLPLCTPCAEALQGRVRKREMPPMARLGKGAA